MPDSGPESLADVAQALHNLGINTADQLEQLQSYVGSVQKWNKHFNLISRADIHRLVRRHILDSLSGSGLLQAGRVVDIGSGAGLPGLVLAIARPDLEFVLIDRHSRKIRFLQQVITQLSLTNVQAREVDLQIGSGWHQAHQGEFANVVSRAVTDIDGLWALARDLMAPGGQLLAYTATAGGGCMSDEGVETDSGHADLQKLSAQARVKLTYFDPYASAPELLDQPGPQTNHTLVQAWAR